MWGLWRRRGLHREHRWLSWVVLPLLVVALMPAVAERHGASARTRYRMTSARVAPGLTVRYVRDRRGPNRIRVLQIDPRQSPLIDVALANNKLPGHETTSSMARRHGAIAAINGDYTVRPSSRGAGRPVDTFIEDGLVKASPLIWGRNFSISRDEQRITFGHNRLRTWLTQLDTGETWAIDDVNPITPSDDGFSLYTQAGGSDFRPPPFACSARLLRTGGPLTWTEPREGVTMDLVVDRVVCRDTPLQRRGGMVVSAPWGSADGAFLKASVFPGETISYGWSFRRPGILDTIGGNPDLLENGQTSIGKCTSVYFCRRNPRTGVGVTADGKLLFVTVDGRQRGSVGMTPWEFADLFRRLGATDALNLDGGGSTTMYLRGEIVNRPSDGHERAVGSALLVLMHPDHNESEPEPFLQPTPTSAPSSSPTATPSPTPSESPGATPSLSPSVGSVALPALGGRRRLGDPLCRALRDPGSTGGLLHALSLGDFGADPDSLPRALRWGLEVFSGTEECL